MPVFTFITLNAASGNTLANGVNVSGQIVGSFGGSHGFLYSGGTFTTIDVPGASATAAYGISASGKIVGSFTDGSGIHGFLDNAGTFLTLNDPVATAGTSAYGINSLGQIVGAYSNGSGVHGFLYSGGVYTTLDDPLASSLGTQTSGINDLGQIVGTYANSTGTHGFLYNQGTYITEDVPAGTSGTWVQGIDNGGQLVGYYSDSIGFHGFIKTGTSFISLDDTAGTSTAANGIANGIIAGTYFDANGAHGWQSNSGSVSNSTVNIQNDYLAITRTALPLDQATTVASAINAGSQTETQYVNGLLSQVANTTIPAVAVEATMYGATGTSAEITSLTTNFLPAQVANATKYGLNAQVYSCEALGLVFAFGNENSSTAFSNNFGPSNSTMPNTTTGDAAFAAAASTAIFGSASTANLVNVMGGFVSFWQGFFTANGVPGLSNATTAQIDVAARGTSWGDMVGVALANNLGPLNGQTINFLDDAAQGSAVYAASLVGQPAHQPFQGA